MEEILYRKFKRDDVGFFIKMRIHQLKEENRKLHQKLEELEKENRFLKKAAAFFAKKID